MTETATPEVMDMEVYEPKGMASIDRAEIDIQIATAKRYPRTVSKCLNDAEDMITCDKATADSAFYELPAFKGSKEVIVGPSIRAAEIVAACWGNLEYGSRPLEVDRVEGVVRAQGYCIDREKNIRFTTVKSRRIKDKYGKLYKDDLINKTMLAAQAIAERDAICKVVPRTYVNQLYQKAMKVADGDVSLEDRIKSALEQFKKLGVDEKSVLTYLEVADKRDITGEQVRHLRGIFTALKEGSATVDEIFGDADKKTAPDIKKPGDEAASEEPKSESKIEQLLSQVEERIAAIGDMDIASKATTDFAKKHKANPDDLSTWTEVQLLGLLVELKKAVPKKD